MIVTVQVFKKRRIGLSRKTEALNKDACFHQTGTVQQDHESHNGPIYHGRFWLIESIMLWTLYPQKSRNPIV